MHIIYDHPTFDRYQHSAVGLPSHIGGIAGVETIITLLAIQDLENEVLSLVLINDVPAALADICSILPPDNVGFWVTRHKAAEFGVFAFSHRAGTGEHTFGQLRQSGCPQLMFQTQPVSDAGCGGRRNRGAAFFGAIDGDILIHFFFALL